MDCADESPEAIRKARERVGRIEDRIRELRAVEYPTITQMNELKAVREEAGEINEYLEVVDGDSNPTGEACGASTRVFGPCDRGLGHPGDHRDAAVNEWPQG